MNKTDDLRYQLNQDNIKKQELGFDKNTIIAFLFFFVFSISSYLYIDNTGFNNMIVTIVKTFIIILSSIVLINYMIAYIKFKKSYKIITDFIKRYHKLNIPEFDQYEYKEKILFVKEFNKGINQLISINSFIKENSNFNQLTTMKDMIHQTSYLFDYLLVNPSQMTNVYFITNKAIGILEEIIKNYNKLDTSYNKELIDKYRQDINDINEMIINETKDIINNKNNHIIDSIKNYASLKKTI